LPLCDLIELPFCKIIRIEAWNAPPHRYFIAYHSRDEFSHVLGLSVIDEFATFSSPIFFAPAPILGKIYNVGITLGHKRGADLDIDSGWPPLCIGTNEPAPELPADFENQMMDAIKRSSGSPLPAQTIRDFQVQFIEIGETSVFATNAPLFSGQLRRICRLTDTPFAIAISTGNRLTRQKDGNTNEVHAVSEAVLRDLCSHIRQRTL
jgi:hypothetical protein